MKNDDLIDAVVKLSNHKRKNILKFNSLIEEYVNSRIEVSNDYIMNILIDSLKNNRTIEETIILVNNYIKEKSFKK